MPGGKSSVTITPPDLASFIVRRRGTVEQWILANNITSPEALQALVAAGNWSISQDLHQQILELVKPVLVAAQDQNLVVVSEPQPVQEEVQSSEVLENNDVVLEDQLVISPKERKKSR